MGLVKEPFRHCVICKIINILNNCVNFAGMEVDTFCVKCGGATVKMDGGNIF